MSKIIVTITPPTPNGNLHLGHIAGPFLAADVFARVNRLRGHEVILLCYSDDYQSYVDRKARELGQERFSLASFYAAEIEKTLSIAGIGVDWFLKAYNNAYFASAVSLFYEEAHKKKAILKKEELVPFSVEDKVFGYEAFARGTCNYCGHESDPSQCEHCARWPHVEQMGDITSVFSQRKMVWKPVTREFLNIDLYRDYLLEYYASIQMRGYLHDFIGRTLAEDNLHWPIDRPGECGIDIDINGHSNRIHTWFSGIAGYYAAFREYADAKGEPGLVQKFWYSSQTDIVHFLGFDCSFSHAIVYPSLMHNVEGMTKNVHFFPNRFLKLEGRDFSTSRGIAIWVNDILQEYSQDVLRFYLALHSPEESTANFEMEMFSKWEASFFTPAVTKLKTIPLSESFARIGQLVYNNQIYEILKSWKKFSSKENFSIRGMANELAHLLDYLNTVAPDEDNTWHALRQLYTVIGLPVHPELSATLIVEFGIDKQEVISWVDELTFEKVSQIDDHAAC